MRIQNISTEPIHCVPYLKAGAGSTPETAQLPVFEGIVDALPASLAAIVCTSDLHGVVHDRSACTDPTATGRSFS